MHFNGGGWLYFKLDGSGEVIGITKNLKRDKYTFPQKSIFNNLMRLRLFFQSTCESYMCGSYLLWDYSFQEVEILGGVHGWGWKVISIKLNGWTEEKKKTPKH